MMKISPILLCIALAAPVYAAPADTATAPAMQAGAVDRDGDDAKINQGSLTDYLWRRSDAAFHAGDYARAVELHRAIVTADPGDVESYGVGAWLLWSLEKGDQADAFIAQGLKNNPDSAAMWEAAGDQYGLEKRPAPERDAYARAVELAGKGADQMLRRRYAHAAENAGDLQQSAKVWRGLVQDFPGEAVNKNNLARVEEKIKAVAEAEQEGAVDEARAEAGAPAKTIGFVGLGALSLLGIGAWKRASKN